MESTESIGSPSPVASSPLQPGGGPGSLAYRAHPLVFGVIIFLASESMFFGGLFAGYYDLRTIATGPWPPADVKLDVLGASIGTLMLALSSGCMAFCTRLLDQGNWRASRTLLFFTFLFGAGYEVETIHGWMNASFTPASHVYGSIFFTMIGFHALHVMVGLLLLIMLFVGFKWRSFNREQRAGAEAIGYYWHFVSIMWLGIWTTLFFVR